MLLLEEIILVLSFSFTLAAIKIFEINVLEFMSSGKW